MKTCVEDSKKMMGRMMVYDGGKKTLWMGRERDRGWREW
jgi:hypothetical protein